jgi:hypothetical protein
MNWQVGVADLMVILRLRPPVVNKQPDAAGQDMALGLVLPRQTQRGSGFVTAQAFGTRCGKLVFPKK